MKNPTFCEISGIFHNLCRLSTILLSLFIPLLNADAVEVLPLDGAEMPAVLAVEGTLEAGARLARAYRVLHDFEGCLGCK